MEYLYDRLAGLKKEEKRLQKDAFNPQIKPVLQEVRIRIDELQKAIDTLEHLGF